MNLKNVVVLYEDNHLLVAHKPQNLLSQKDITNDDDILSILKQYIKEKYNKPNEVYLGLVHRLDRMTSGVMVFARTSKAAARLSSDIVNHRFYKTYQAVVEGSLEVKNSEITLNLLKDEKNNKSYVSENGKTAILNYQVLNEKNNLSLVEINLKTGRHHQIRATFSYLNHPLYGDIKYGSKCRGNLALKAPKLSFYHPITKELLTFTYNDDSIKEFKIFSLKEGV